MQPSAFDSGRPTYPAVRFILRYGWLLSTAAALAPLGAAIWAVTAGYSPLWLIVGVLAGGVSYLLMRSYTELVAIIADMLLPK